MKLIFSFFLFYHILLVQCEPALKQPNGKLSYEENEILQEKCGHFDSKSAQKSINSKRVQRNVAPWVVAVADNAGFLNANFTKTHCSGTLISSRHVLSARHCLLKPVTETIYRGSYSHSKDAINATTKDGRLIYLAKDNVLFESFTNLQEFRFVFHNDCGADFAGGMETQCKTKDAIVRRAVKAFSPNTRLTDFTIGGSDLLIFELDKPVEEEQNIYPACLAGDGKEINESSRGMLQHISITTIPCLIFNSPDVVCTRSNNQTVDHGDSGGGFIYKSSGINYVTAVVSGGGNITRNYFEYAQTAVAPHLDWICEHVGICVNQTQTPQIRPEIEIIAIR